MKFLLSYGITGDDPDCVDDSASLTSCNKERNPFLSTSASCIGRIAYRGLDSVNSYSAEQIFSAV